MSGIRISLLLTCLTGFLYSGLVFAQQDTFLLLDTQPSFPGGGQALTEFMHSNVKYPAAARDSIIQGMVYVSFVVEADGSVTNIKVLRDIGGGCGEEAKRVIGIMPRWEPGSLNGVPMRASVSMPVRFTFSGGVIGVVSSTDSAITYSYSSVDEIPNFPGGDGALEWFLINNLKYPTEARVSGIQGKVIVTFIVEADGTVSNAKVSRDIGGGCGDEALKVIGLMPKWEPGKIGGQPVAVKMSIPVTFVQINYQPPKPEKKRKR